MVEWLAAPDYWWARVGLQRGIGLLYLIAFVNVINQFRPLLGERGLLPVPRFAERVGFRRAPSLFTWRYSDRLLLVAGWAGIAGAVLIVTGVVERWPLWGGVVVWALLWVLYLSVVNVGQIFYAFGWESILLEAGFFAALLGPATMEPPLLVLLWLRWLLFRVEFGAGLIKLRGDPCWRDLTCLYYHHETQPLPGPLSWSFHRLPKALHKVEVAANHLTQLVIPFGLFAPQPVAGVSAAAIVVTQAWLVASGNFSWLNAIAIVLAAAAIPDTAFEWLLPAGPVQFAPIPAWYGGVLVALTAAVVVLSWRPVRNMLSRQQLMNFSFNRFHLVGTYGAFGAITRTRNEIVVEGTRSWPAGPDARWEPYEFKAKPGDPHRRPPQVAPYHLRLDWLLWFAAMSEPARHPWLVQLVRKLLEGDEAVLRLLRRNPFADAPPTAIRAQLYRYRFTTRAERRETGAWWHRTLMGEYLPTLTREPEVRQGRRQDISRE